MVILRIFLSLVFLYLRVLKFIYSELNSNGLLFEKRFCGKKSDDYKVLGFR